MLATLLTLANKGWSENNESNLTVAYMTEAIKIIDYIEDPYEEPYEPLKKAVKNPVIKKPKKPVQRQLSLKKYSKKKWNLFGQKLNSSYYQNIFAHPDMVKVCYCSGDIEILQFRLHKTQVIENRKGVDYNGWIDLNDGSLDSVWASLIQLKMCIPSDYKKKEEQGLGLLVRLTVKSLGIVPEPKKVKEPEIEEKKEEMIFNSLPMRKISF